MYRGRVSMIQNVLIVGNDGAFLVELVNKFFKEGWHVDLLTETQLHSRLPGEVTAYRFGVASASVKDLMESCLPQLVLFTGAYDPLSARQEDPEQGDSSAYVAGLNNILTYANAAGVKQFIYLSSEAVFEAPSSADITEDAKPTPQSPFGLRIAQGEAVAAAFGRFSAMEVTIVRIADLYCVPRSQDECTDRFTKLCLSALLTGTVAVNFKRIGAPLFVSDAVFALHRIATAPKRSATVYHLAASEEANEEDVAQAMKRAFSKPITIVDQTSGVTNRRVLSGARAAEEFGFTARMNFERAIAMIVSYMEEHRKNYGVPKKRGLLDFFKTARAGLGGVFPFLECVVYFIPFYFLNALRDQTALLSQVDFFLLFVFLFALLRGRATAIVAFCLSVLGRYLQLSQSEDFLKLLISMDTYVWIVQLFVVGISTGYLRDKLMQSRQEGQENERYLKKRLEEITAINQSNTQIKNSYAERLVNSGESVGWFYDVITELDGAASGEVIFRAVKLLMRLMGTDHVAIYTMNEANYCRLAATSSSRAAELGKSIHIPDVPELFQPLMEKNGFFNPEIVSDLPSMASSLVGADNTTRLFIFLWDLPFDKKNLHYSNLLKVVGTLIYNAVARSARYLDALAHKRLIVGTQLLKKDAFQEMLGVYQKVSDMGLAQYCVLKIKLDELTTREEMDQKIRACVRQTDIVGMIKKQKIGIILSNSTEIDGQIVKDRLAAAGIVAKLSQPVNAIIGGAVSKPAVADNGVIFKESLQSLTRRQAENASSDIYAA
jgi:nucleoside-diphosphate-sugar epimerase